MRAEDQTCRQRSTSVPRAAQGCCSRTLGPGARPQQEATGLTGTKESQGCTPSGGREGERASFSGLHRPPAPLGSWPLPPAAKPAAGPHPPAHSHATKPSADDSQDRRSARGHWAHRVAQDTLHTSRSSALDVRPVLLITVVSSQLK